MGILDSYTHAYPSIIKFSAGCPTEQSCPVLRVLFTFTDHLVRGLEQMRLVYPGFPVVRGKTAYQEFFSGIQDKTHSMLENAGVYNGLESLHPFLENAFLTPDYSRTIGDIEPIKPWIESLKTPRTLVDEDRAPTFQRFQTLLQQLEGASDEKQANLLLEFRLTVELETEELSMARDRVVERMRRAEQMVNSIREERIQRNAPPPRMGPIPESALTR